MVSAKRSLYLNAQGLGAGNGVAKIDLVFEHHYGQANDLVHACPQLGENIFTKSHRVTKAGNSLMVCPRQKNCRLRLDGVGVLQS